MIAGCAGIADHCRALGIVGEGLQVQLDRQLVTPLLETRATRPVAISGPGGSGRSLAARFCHQVAGQELGRRGELITLDCAGSRTLFENEAVRQGLFGLARQGTLVFDRAEELTPRSQQGLADLLRQTRDQAETFPVLILTEPPATLAREGRLAPPLADQLSRTVALPPLFARGAEIQELATHFLRAAGQALDPARTLQFTRRALSDLRQAVEGRQIPSVSRLEEVVRQTVHLSQAAGTLTDRLPSELLLPLLEGLTPEELRRLQAERDLAELDAALPELVDQAMLVALAERHQISRETLEASCHVMEDLLQGEQGQLSYPQVVERSRIISRVALWLVSGAHTQADFRRFFGKETWRMPTKSVAWAMYHEVVGDPDEGGEP